jgi:hypothetical protein
LIANIEIIPEKKEASVGNKSGEPCYVQIPRYKQKKTVDDFLKAIEYDLNRKEGVTLTTLDALRAYCDLVINDKVGCLVSDAQKAKAEELKKKAEELEKKQSKNKAKPR